MLVLSRIHRAIRRLFLGVRHRLTNHQFFIGASVFVGLSAGAVAVAMKFLSHKMASFAVDYSQSHHVQWLISFLPMIGILLTVIYVKKILQGPYRKGIAEIQYTITKHSSLLPKSQMYSHAITGVLTVAFGGSTGLESPIVSSGSALGSSFGRAYTLSYKERTILLACGAAAGIAAAFNAPIAGVLFAIEVVLTEISIAAFIPLIIAAACGALLSKVVLHEGTILSFKLQQAFDYHNVPYYILLGLLAGLLSFYFSKSFPLTQTLTQRVTSPWLRVVVGGVVMGSLIMIFPPLYGEGYHTVITLAEMKPQVLSRESIVGELFSGEWMLLLFLSLVMFVKAVAAGLTLGAGGNGGSFGPSLFMGAYLGFTLAHILNLTGLVHLPETNFLLVGMAGLLSGVFHAPLSAIFLIAEITGGYELMIPLMIVSALSLAITRFFQPLSMEAKKLSEKLNHSIHTRDHYLLSRLELHRLIEKDFVLLNGKDSLQTLVNAISKSHRNTFPVLGEAGELIGIIQLNDVRATIFQTELYQSVMIKDLMTQPLAKVSPNESLHNVLKKFDEARQWNLPVVEENKYVGFVSKASILAKYRQELMNSL